MIRNKAFRPQNRGAFYLIKNEFSSDIYQFPFTFKAYIFPLTITLNHLIYI
jgi:hypothetical protein